MIRTLSLFLSRELWKAAGLSLVAFTLVMTVFAIIEPMHKEGLAAGQLASLLGYTLPVMLSLTMPVAALFATTIVYGRFSQDNELTACRASGISTLRLLKPAMVLGGVVTLASLFLSNYVTPHMIGLGERSVRANIVGIVRQKFRAQSYIDYSGYYVHADQVEQYTDTLQLRGVVAADAHRRSDQRFLTASTAVVSFSMDQGQVWATVTLISPTVSRSNSRDIVEQASMPLPPMAMPEGPIREDVSWYNWDDLAATLGDPMRNIVISRELTKIKRRICHDRVAEDIVREITRGLPYEKLTREGDVYSIRAGAAGKSGETVELTSAEGGRRPVEVLVMRGGRTVSTITSEEGTIEMAWSAMEGTSQATIELRHGVVVGAPDGTLPAQRRAEWDIGQLNLPAEIRQETDQISLEDIYTRAAELTSNADILRDTTGLSEQMVRRLLNRIKAEMHSRIAYGVSCFLMVTLGAALGLMFRGGQLISAFALSVVPAAVVIVMMLMGKQLVRAPAVPTIFGLAAIWSGIIALIAADAAVLTHLSRK
ncbi:MAG: LptF/LptG family permease [Phycisphaerae bacterium]|nr:LptF/LptG family permease [Phycisphaerae bacterium]